jgi:hypothetical protein
VSRGRTFVFPASYAQERMWFLSQLAPDLGVCNLSGFKSLPPGLDACRLWRALEEVVRRHETLRTSFALQARGLVQVVHEDVPVTIGHSDLSALPSAQRERELERIAAGDAAAPFACDGAPLWRARIVRLTADDCRLLLVAHHAVYDAASAERLTAELLEIYTAGSEGRQPRLPELAIQYADYAVWQRTRLEQGAFDAELEHWAGRLAGLPAGIGLPGDRPRPARPSYLGGECELWLSADQTARLSGLAREAGVTLFTVLLAGFAAVLSRHSGQVDLVIGTPVAGRDVPELTPLIGMFVNMLLLRLDLSGEPTFHELVGRVQANVLEALDHAEVPFQKVVERLGLDRDPSRPALPQVVFNMFPVDSPLGTRVTYGNGTAKHDLWLEMASLGGRLHSRLEYSRDLFDERRMEVLLEDFRARLEAA